MSYKAGFVGIIGQPNSGKSTLLNEIVKEKVSIVTSKPQTTRRRVLGIHSEKNGQIVFVDAPGIVHASKGLNSFLEKEALEVISQSDALLCVLSIDEKDKEQIEEIFQLMLKTKKPKVILINKVDILKKRNRVQIIKDRAKELNLNVKIHEFSNQWGKDIEFTLKEVIKDLFDLLPDSVAPLYDIEMYTPHTVREMVAEIIREKCFELLTQEVPYSIAVRVGQFDESNPKLIKIYADLLVSKESHKPIVIGKKAETVKTIGMKARSEIEKMLNKKVFLKIEVLVRDDWQFNSGIMKDLGYVVNDK